jgi:hypothetical protein
MKDNEIVTTEARNSLSTEIEKFRLEINRTYPTWESLENLGHQYYHIYKLAQDLNGTENGKLYKTLLEDVTKILINGSSQLVKNYFVEHQIYKVSYKDEPRLNYVYHQLGKFSSEKDLPKELKNEAFFVQREILKIGKYDKEFEI